MNQSQRILAYLKRGGKLTALKGLELFDCMSLSQRIGNLKVAGHQVDSRTITLKNKKRISEYFIKK